eukprot:scaffold23729_cov120-Isochrysis_galbana.AAC.2
MEGRHSAQNSEQSFTAGAASRGVGRTYPLTRTGIRTYLSLRATAHQPSIMPHCRVASHVGGGSMGMVMVLRAAHPGHNYVYEITNTGYRRIQVCADTMVVRIRPESWYPPPFPWSRLCLYHSRGGSRLPGSSFPISALCRAGWVGALRGAL